MKHERRAIVAIDALAVPAIGCVPAAHRRDPGPTACRSVERRTGERRVGVGSIEPRRTVGRRSELLPIDIALAELRASSAARVPVAGSRANPWAGALFLSALACSGLLGHVVGEGARVPAGEVVPWPASDPIGPGRGVAASSPDDPEAVGRAPFERPARTLPGLGAALADDAGGSGVVRVAGTGGPGADDIGEIETVADRSAGDPVDPLWSELGRVRAEILRLRVLFRRLAEVAELDDGEFDLDPDPSELPAARRAAAALDLSIRALDPISTKSARMERIFDERRAAHDRRVGGRVAPGTVRSSGFGFRPGPFGGRRELHRGVDLAGPPGTPIHALADGIVAFSGANGGYGNLVEIEHGDGYRTRYAHNRSNLVAVGERVAKGDVVATLGSSGRSTGPHVHVEVRRDGAALDPAIHLR